MEKQIAGMYIKSHDKRAGELSRMTKRMLEIIDAQALENSGTLRLFGSLSKDELIASILKIEYPDITEARAAYATETEPAKIRPLYIIAREIRATWPRPYFGAVPYLVAMGGLESVNEMFGQETARSIVQYFLVNAGTWRGDNARRIKNELREMVKS